MEDILQVESLDAIIVGPYDLSASIGLTADFAHSDFLTLMDNILDLCKKYKIPCGYHIVEPNPELIKQRIDKGYRFIAYSIDAMFLHNSVEINK